MSQGLRIMPSLTCVSGCRSCRLNTSLLRFSRAITWQRDPDAEGLQHGEYDVGTGTPEEAPRGRQREGRKCRETGQQPAVRRCREPYSLHAYAGVQVPPSNHCFR